MNSKPTVYIVVPPDSTHDPSECEIGSNLDWCKGRAKQIAERRQGTTTVYKLVPVFEARLEVITNVLTKDLAEDEKAP